MSVSPSFIASFCQPSKEVWILLFFWGPGAHSDVIVSPCWLSVHTLLLFSGWIVSLAAMNSSVAVGAIMMINAIFFTAQAAMGVVLLKKVKTELFPWHLIGNGHELRSCLHQSAIPSVAAGIWWCVCVCVRVPDAEPCIHRILSACSAHCVLRSTACTGKPTPASRRLRPSSPPGSCPIRRCARRPSTWPPTLPRGLSTHLDRMRSGRGFGGWQVEEKEGVCSS